MKKSTVSVKVSLFLFSFAVMLLLIVVWFSMDSNLKAIEGEILEQKEKNIATLLLAEEMRYSSAQVQQWYTDVSATRDPEGYEEVEIHAKKFRESLNQLDELDSSTLDVINISDKFEEFYQTGRKMAEAYINDGTEAGNIIMEDFDEKASDMVELSFGIVEAEQTKLENSYSSILATTAGIKKEILMIFIGFLIAFSVAAVLITKKILTPLNKMIEGANKFTAGDFREPIQIKEKDELGVLGEALNKMSHNLKALIGEIVEASKNLDYKSQELAASSQEVGASTQQVASTTNTLVLQAEDSAGNTEKTVQEGEKVLSIADVGNQAVKNTIEKINVISEYTLECGKEIKELGQLSSNINNITKVITDIADQTNLLALNAAIEAARAGEQGKGFAVVAEEVRKLAEESSRAAKEIGELVKKIETKVEDSVIIVERNIEEVNEGVNLASQAGNAINQIVQAIDNIVLQVKDISQVIREYHSRMEDLSSANSQISDTIEQVVITTQELASMSSELNEAVNKFKV